jgi:hypothetical protein
VGTFAELIVQTPDQLAAFGPIERIVRSWFADPWTRRYVYDTRLGGFGIEWPLLLVLGLAGAALLAGRRRFAPLVLLALPAALTLVTMPMSWWARLTLFVPLLVVGLAAVALTRLPRPAAGALGALIVLATTASLGVATAHGNAYVQQGRSLPSLSVMLRLVRASAEERGSLGIWGECASLAAIPPGSRVAWDSFNMLHAIAGHRYDRFAIAPITATSDSSSLFEQARALDVDILLLHDAGVSLRAATRDPQRFTILGPGCRGTQIVAVSQDTARSP